jgi:hypothetical protein
MKAQCTRYWRKCCIRTGHESFTHQLPGLCHTCQVRRPNDHDIAKDDSIHITIRLKPSMAMEKAAVESAKGRPIIPADLPTPDNVKSYITNCLKRYQQAHNLPEDSVKVSDAECTPIVRGSRVTGDAYHHHSCGLGNPNCKKLEDYQMQLMLLEHQNKRRLMIAAAETDATTAIPKPPITTPSFEETKFRHYKLQEYQRELMREAMQANKEQPVCNAPSQGEIVAPTKPEPQDPLNVQAMKNLSLEEYQKQLMVLRCGNRKRDMLQFQPAATGVPQSATDEPRLASVEAHGQQQAWDRTRPRNAPMAAGAPPVPARAPINSYSTLASADYLKNRQHRSPLQDYNMQLMLLEQQNRKRLMMARQEQDKAVVDGAATPDDLKNRQHRSALQDYNMQLKLLEQQNRNRLIMARPKQDKAVVDGVANSQEGGKSKQQADESATLATHEWEKLAINGGSNAQESEQIPEMGSALGAQNSSDKGNVSEVVHTEPEDEPDTAMWSTDEFDEWSNCEDDEETAERLEL